MSVAKDSTQLWKGAGELENCGGRGTKQPSPSRGAGAEGRAYRGAGELGRPSSANRTTRRGRREKSGEGSGPFRARPLSFP